MADTVDADAKASTAAGDSAAEKPIWPAEGAIAARRAARRSEKSDGHAASSAMAARTSAAKAAVSNLVLFMVMASFTE